MLTSDIESFTIKVIMFRIIRVILYRLWIVSFVTVISSVIIHFCYGFYSSLFVFSLGLAGLLYSAQDILLYYPNDPPDSRIFVLQPSTFKLPYENIKIKTNDGYQLHLFLIKQENSAQAPTLIFFHGNAGNMGQRLHNASGFYNILHVNVLMVEYRGYGLSEGAPTERGLYIDAQTAFDYALQRPDLDTQRIIVFGRSLGGAVAVDLASRAEYRARVWALVAENTFTSIPDMAIVVLRWRCLRWMPHFVHKNKYKSIDKIGSVTAPTLLVCGSKDALVPPVMSQTLLARCGAVVKRLAVIENGGHDDSWTFPEYYPTLEAFLRHAPTLAEDRPYFDNQFESVVVETV